MESQEVHAKQKAAAERRSSAPQPQLESEDLNEQDRKMGARDDKSSR